ncbi:MAG: RNA-binding transcriptional accessory protein [Firmicutes bacterium]|nr:RNA-binding transcriptional accessory protein [Bacillota bacterium]
MDISNVIAQELKIRRDQVESATHLLDEGNTIPFIARYRKEATGELDEVVLRSIEEQLRYYRSLEERKSEILRLIEEQGKLTEELKQTILQAARLQDVEDLYRPYRQKRRTRATMAEEKGLRPLAELIFKQKLTDGDPDAVCGPYVQPHKGVGSVPEAQAGALDIIAQWIADDAKIRSLVRGISEAEGLLATRCRLPAEPSGELPVSKYEIYYDFSEELGRIPAHRILAVNRGEKEEVLQVSVVVPEEKIIEAISQQVIHNPNSLFASELRATCRDAYQRLLAPSIERELRNQLTERAELQSIQIFSANLRQLLLQPPVQGKRVMGIDPAYRTGCKVALLDEQGDLLCTSTIYPHAPQRHWEEAKEELLYLIEKYAIEIITIGNGTASRETEVLVAEVIDESARELHYLIVNEAGASVYSASDLAREEFPKLDVSLRGAISIGRRLQDPLAELVKIDPGSIGVGQYQHDVNQKRLGESLQAVVESCVNYVGVELNTASPALLQHVAGISTTLSRRIVEYRQAQGPFYDRKQLLEIRGLGEKTFTQCAGFLRIREAANPLDNTPVHPESYSLAEAILEQAQVPLEALVESASTSTPQLRTGLAKLKPGTVARKLNAGLPTVRDIIAALLQPGRDPRETLPKPLFRKDILTLDDLRDGMLLYGTVTNVVDFGAFVDIGVGRDGLVHISQMSHSYVSHPLEVVSVGDIVQVRVLDVDQQRERISLSLLI